MFGPIPDAVAAAPLPLGGSHHPATNNYNAYASNAAPAYAASASMAGGGLSDLHKTVLQSIKSVKGGEGVALVIWDFLGPFFFLF